MTGTLRAGGVDGCRAGWVLACVTSAPTRPAMGASLELRVVPHFTDALDLVRGGVLAALGVDMPIGLPDSGAREADRAARRRLGARRSSVFPTPSRAVLGTSDYLEALARSRAVTGRGLSKQAFHLLPRIAEVDEAMTPALQSCTFECHPETAFARLAGAPLAHPKRTPEGRAERLALLAPCFEGARVPDPGSTVPRGSRPDDVLDAIVVALTALRFAAGDVERLGDGALDRRGLRMEIVV